MNMTEVIRAYLLARKEQNEANAAVGVATSRSGAANIELNRLASVLSKDVADNHKGVTYAVVMDDKVVVVRSYAVDTYPCVS